MVAQHQDALIVSALQKRLKGIDPARAYAAIRHDLTTPGVALPDGQYAGDRQLATYVAHGYVPDEAGPSSNTFEYAFDDYCLAELAAHTGHHADAAMFARRAGSWRNAIDPATGYARARLADGTWKTPFDPMLYGTVGGWNGRGFVEGTPWTYSFWVPQDIAGLIALTGRDRFNARLEAGFANGDVDLTNQPGLAAPFLFNYSGKPWLTQYWTRKVIAENYDTSPLRGWRGEEDEGQLTAYFALLAMGLFEVDGGCNAKPWYDLTSPRLPPDRRPPRPRSLSARSRPDHRSRRRSRRRLYPVGDLRRPSPDATADRSRSAGPRRRAAFRARAEAERALGDGIVRRRR